MHTSVFEPVEPEISSYQKKVIAFIDPGVDDYHSLMAGTLPDIEVILLDANRDGIEQIVSKIATYTDIEAVHIISHGSPGCLNIGNSQLSLDTLKHYAKQLKTCSIRQLLLYGCCIATNEVGRKFLEQLHRLTGSQIAASRTFTGSSALGGNWDLEVTLGKITSPLAFQPEVMQNYASVFASITLVDNLSQPGGSFGNVSPPPGFAQAQQFTTNNENYVLDSVILKVGEPTGNINIVAGIYNNAGNIPGSVIGTLNVPNLSGGIADRVFTANGIINLPANTNYWVALINTGESGSSISWSSSNNTNFTGPGNLPARFTTSGNNGVSWNGVNGTPYQLAVNATVAVPYDFNPTMGLLLLGLLWAIPTLLKRRHSAKPSSQPDQKKHPLS